MAIKEQVDTSFRAQLDTVGRSLKRSWVEGRRVERVAFVLSAVLFTSGLVHLVTLLISGGTWIGPLSMRKPTTFGLSFGVTLASVTWATSFLRMPDRLRAIVLGAFTATCVVEVSLVSLQFWRGRPSHFNFETGTDTAITATLAAGGMVIIASAVVWVVTAFRAVADARPSMKLALRFGFVTFLVAMGVGMAMIATGTSSVRGGNPEVAYTTAGFLKPAHFVAMHAILVIPGMAWLLTFTRWPEQTRLRIVQLGVAGYLLLTVVTIIESVTHVSPLKAPVVGSLGSAIGVVAIAVAGVAALYGLARRAIT
jgi:hypothetical protein